MELSQVSVPWTRVALIVHAISHEQGGNPHALSNLGFDGPVVLSANSQRGLATLQFSANGSFHHLDALLGVPLSSRSWLMQLVLPRVVESKVSTTHLPHRGASHVLLRQG